MDPNKIIMIRKYLPLTILLFSVLINSISGSSVPVFRYALECWQPDPYTVRVFYQGNLNKEQQQAIEILKQIRDKGLISLHLIDIGKELSANVEPAYERNKDTPLPFVVANYHLYSRIPNDAAVFTLDLNNIENFINSPARKEAARRLMTGDSAVFIQIDGEDDKENKKTAKQIESMLREMEKQQKLPHETLEDDEKLDKKTIPYNKNIKIRYSLLRISRKNPSEKLFLQTLLNCSKKLKGIKTPIIMPIFGRGRATFAYAAEGINKENIMNDGLYFVGPCSCEIKAQNPGFDILMNTAWDKTDIDDKKSTINAMETKTLKKLPAVPEDDINLKSDSTINEKPENQQLSPNIFLSLAGIVVLAFILIKYLSRK